MTMNPPTTTLDLDRLAVDLERGGPVAVTTHLDALVDRARVLGIDTPSLDALTDPDAAAVVRNRAFALVTAQLRRLGRTRPNGTLTAAA